jgi:hypothetical protein
MRTVGVKTIDSHEPTFDTITSSVDQRAGLPALRTSTRRVELPGRKGGTGSVRSADVEACLSGNRRKGTSWIQYDNSRRAGLSMKTDLRSGCAGPACQSRHRVPRWLRDPRGSFSRAAHCEYVADLGWPDRPLSRPVSRRRSEGAFRSTFQSAAAQTPTRPQGSSESRCSSQSTVCGPERCSQERVCVETVATVVIYARSSGVATVCPG